MYNIFIIIFRANCLFFCADRINFLLLLFHFEPFYFFSTYVRPKGTCIRRHTTCLSLWLRIIDAIILLFWSSFLGLIKVQIFYISVFYSYITIILIFLLYNCCFFCYYFVIFFVNLHYIQLIAPTDDVPFVMRQRGVILHFTFALFHVCHLLSMNCININTS